MQLDAKAISKQIDEVLEMVADGRAKAQYKDMSDLGHTQLSELIVTLAETIERFAPSGSTYCTKSESVSTQYGPKNKHIQVALLEGILLSLKRAYLSGYLETIQELVHADVFAHFLEMADYLLAEHYKDAAAVIGGSTLEETIRNLCIKHGLATTDMDGKPKKASVLNDDLAKARVYDKLIQKSVTAWLDLRNKAAHGDYASYDERQVAIFLQSIRDFFLRFPA